MSTLIIVFFSPSMSPHVVFQAEFRIPNTVIFLEGGGEEDFKGKGLGR